MPIEVMRQTPIRAKRLGKEARPLPLNLCFKKAKKTNIMKLNSSKNFSLFIDVIEPPYIPSQEIRHREDGMTFPAREVEPQQKYHPQDLQEPQKHF